MVKSQIDRLGVLNPFSHPAIDIRVSFLQAHGPKVHKLLKRLLLIAVAVSRDYTCSISSHSQDTGATYSAC